MEESRSTRLRWVSSSSLLNKVRVTRLLKFKEEKNKMNEKDFMELAKNKDVFCIVTGNKETIDFLQNYEHTTLKNLIPYSIFGMRIFMTDKIKNTLVMKEVDYVNYVEERI
jgi:hypothetical protein